MSEYTGIRENGIDLTSLRSKIETMWDSRDPELWRLARQLCSRYKIPYKILVVKQLVRVNAPHNLGYKWVPIWYSLNTSPNFQLHNTKECIISYERKDTNNVRQQRQGTKETGSEDMLSL